MASRRKLYLPKEHGSWGMFFIPMCLGFLVGGLGSWTGALFLAAAIGLFLLREPFLAWWRLKRRNQSIPADLRAVIAAYLLLTVLPGLGAAAARSLLVPLGVAALVGLMANAELVMRGKGRIATTEVAAILASVLTAPVAYYVGTGDWNGTAWTLWALSALYFVSSVFYVKLRVQAAHPRPGASTARVRWYCGVYHAFALLALAGAVLYGQLPVVAAAAFTPVIARGFWAVARLPRSLNLKRVGWTEVLFSGVFLACVSATLY